MVSYGMKDVKTKVLSIVNLIASWKILLIVSSLLSNPKEFPGKNSSTGRPVAVEKPGKTDSILLESYRVTTAGENAKCS